VASVSPTSKYEEGVVIANKYRLERKLGEGGMGSVWAAHHVALDTAVAIKVIRSDSNRQELAPRLLQEARAAAKLGHPAIVRVFDVGQTADGDPFIVMELLEGESLNQRLGRELRLSATQAVQLLLPIADALRAAHQKGIVHRDIKPDNVFLVADATGVQPKLVDFGIAKLAVREFDSQLTQRGAVVGSPDYMAPEQARGDDDIDRRADVWSFCVLLYETMTGGPPFQGSNYNALMRAILEEPPPLLTSLCAADSELAELVQTGLAKDRAERWQSMQELGEALARWLQKQGVFEDAAGNSIEAKWLSRRADAYRQSQPSFGSIPGYATTTPEGSRPPSPSTARRLAAEAPTSFGPVVTRPGLRARRRLLVPAALGFALLVAVAVRLLWPRSALPETKPRAVAQVTLPAPAATAPAATAPADTAPADTAPADTKTTEPLVVPEPTPVASVPTPKAHHQSPRKPRSAAPARSVPEKPALDLLTPY
jgi:serine/threonine-protein kinase